MLSTTPDVEVIITGLRTIMRENITFLFIVMIFSLRSEVFFPIVNAQLNNGVKVKVGEACLESDKCVEHANCVYDYMPCDYGICRCDGSACTSVNNGTCHIRGRYNSSCTLNSDCLSLNAACVTDVCGCKNQTTYLNDAVCFGNTTSFSGDKCTRGDICVFHDNSTISYSTRRCPRGLACGCDIGYKPWGHSCIPTKLYDGCLADIDCSVVYSRCHRGFCVCKIGYTPLYNWHCRPHKGYQSSGQLCNSSAPCDSEHICIKCPGAQYKTCVTSHATSTEVILCCGVPLFSLIKVLTIVLIMG